MAHLPSSVLFIMDLSGQCGASSNTGLSTSRDLTDQSCCVNAVLNDVAVPAGDRHARPAEEDCNAMERLTLACMAHLPTLLLSVIDLNEQCGTSMAAQ